MHSLILSKRARKKETYTLKQIAETSDEYVNKAHTHTHHIRCAYTRSFGTSRKTRMRPRKWVSERAQQSKSNRTVAAIRTDFVSNNFSLRFTSPFCFFDRRYKHQLTPVQALYTRICTLNAVCVYNIVHIIKSGHVFSSLHIAVCFCSVAPAAAAAAVFVWVLHFYAMHCILI